MNRSDSRPIDNLGVGEFFDGLTDDYSLTIEKCFPRYREMLWATLHYLPPEITPRRILELGCGTGNLSHFLVQRFPDCEIELVDLSRDSIDACRDRFRDQGRVSFRQADFRELSYESGQFDLVVSSIAVHHLIAKEKRQLFSSVFDWLGESGTFAYADQFLAETEDIAKRHQDHWRKISSDAGSTDEQWEMWMQHQQQHDHHDTLFDQVEWLREAGFSVVDSPWRYLLWAVLQARKSG